MRKISIRKVVAPKLLSYNLAMDTVLLVNKPLGLTPLETIQKVKVLRPERKDTKIGYAGRLDPMAEGLLLLLVGDTNKKKHMFENMHKTYICEMVLGYRTDTYDLLGIVTQVKTVTTDMVNQAKMLFSHLPGMHDQPFPPFSSKTVKGKPLYYWARKGKLDEIVLPSKQIEIFSVSDISIMTTPSSLLKQTIQQRIASVSGDFRQKEILKRWNTVLEEKNTSHTLISATIRCSSGTYIRGVVNEIGEKVGCGAVATRIYRTEIGPYRITEAVEI